MVSLGLSSDIEFLKKVMRAINAEKFAPGQNDAHYTQGEIKMPEFLNLFR